MKVLLHSCCAPCANQCIDILHQEGCQPTLFWYNPNIHPFTEFRLRRDSLRTYAQLEGLPMIDGGEYELRMFLTETMGDIDNRCRKCYMMRIEKTAMYAAENGYDGFTTSLLISPYQNHGEIKQIASEFAAQYKVNFIYKDFRPHFKAGQQTARDLGLYMQKYCGCIFSEEERFIKSKKAKISQA